MADRETQIVNFYESTLASLLASAATSTTLTNAPTTNGTTTINASGSSYYYLVIDPDNSATREVVLVTSSSGTTISAMTRDIEGRHTGSDPDHQAGTTVRMAVLAEHFADINDRVDADAVVVATHTGETTKHFLLVDEDNMASNSATVAASQQSVKAYVDAQTSGGVSLGLVLALS
jgi:hypothetical protein